VEINEPDRTHITNSIRSHSGSGWPLPFHLPYSSSLTFSSLWIRSNRQLNRLKKVGEFLISCTFSVRTRELVSKQAVWGPGCTFGFMGPEVCTYPMMLLIKLGPLASFLHFRVKQFRISQCCFQEKEARVTREKREACPVHGVQVPGSLWVEGRGTT
jgi:hypothetical protein